jgi:hypothetical protein
MNIEKYREPQYWLDRVEFLKSEFKRLGQNIRIDLLSSALLCIGVASVGMYAVPFLSAGLQFACCAVTAAAIVAILLYEYFPRCPWAFGSDRMRDVSQIPDGHFSEIWNLKFPKD